MCKYYEKIYFYLFRIFFIQYSFISYKILMYQCEQKIYFLKYIIIKSNFCIIILSHIFFYLEKKNFPFSRQHKQWGFTFNKLNGTVDTFCNIILDICCR